MNDFAVCTDVLRKGRFFALFDAKTGQGLVSLKAEMGDPIPPFCCVSNVRVMAGCLYSVRVAINTGRSWAKEIAGHD